MSCSITGPEEKREYESFKNFLENEMKKMSVSSTGNVTVQERDSNTPT